MKKGYEYNDVLVKPIPSNVTSRNDVDISVKFKNGFKLGFPLIASPMETVVNGAFAKTLSDLGGLAIFHRFYDPKSDLFLDIGRNVDSTKDNFGLSVKLGEPDFETHLSYNPRILLVDTANGYNFNLLKYCEKIKNYIEKERLDVLLMAGNVCTKEGCKNLSDSGCDIIRVNIGSGAPCSTRNITGIGIPTVTALQDCDVTDRKYMIVADGGINNSGDFVKAIVAGADFCMAGKLFAECYEAPAKEEYSGMACYDENTEILTKKGWKYYNEINKDDLFATMNQNTHFLEYQKAIGVYNYDYNGDMVSINSGCFDVLVTKNHELFLAKNKQKHKNYIFRKVFAEDIIGKGVNYFKKDFENWTGVELEIFTDIKDYAFEITDWLWFFGFWMAEGSTSFGKNKNGTYFYNTSISNTDNLLIERVINFYKKYNIKCNTRNRVIKSGKINCEVNTCNKNITHYLMGFGKSTNKFIPDYLKDLNGNLLNIFLEGFNEGDGSKTKKCLYTSSNKLRDDLFEILLKIGYVPSISIIHKKESVYGKFKRSNDSYAINYGKRKMLIETRQNHYSLKPYNGKVWCVEVPNGLVYVRRNFKSLWCGNSKSHMVKKGIEVKSVEGIDIPISKKHSLEDFVKEFGFGIKSAGTYLNSNNLSDIWLNGEFIQVTDSAIKKGL